MTASAAQGVVAQVNTQSCTHNNYYGVLLNLILHCAFFLQSVLDVSMELHAVEERGDIVCVTVQDGMVAAIE